LGTPPRTHLPAISTKPSASREANVIEIVEFLDASKTSMYFDGELDILNVENNKTPSMRRVSNPKIFWARRRLIMAFFSIAFFDSKYPFFCLSKQS
jgi:hypothetical protein